MPAPTDLHDWQHNEALLQSYRKQFLGSQSLLLLLGAVLVGRSAWGLVAIGLLALTMIWGVWFPVIRSRQLVVDYHKFAARLNAEQRAGLCALGDYVRNPAARRQANQVFGLDSNWRDTRVKLDLLLPALMSGVWLVLLVM